MKYVSAYYRGYREASCMRAGLIFECPDTYLEVEVVERRSGNPLVQ